MRLTFVQIESDGPLDVAQVLAAIGAAPALPPPCAVGVPAPMIGAAESPPAKDIRGYQPVVVEPPKPRPPANEDGEARRIAPPRKTLQQRRDETLVALFDGPKLITALADAMKCGIATVYRVLEEHPNLFARDGSSVSLSKAGRSVAEVVKATS